MAGDCTWTASREKARRFTLSFRRERRAVPVLIVDDDGDLQDAICETLEGGRHADNRQLHKEVTPSGSRRKSTALPSPIRINPLATRIVGTETSDAANTLTRLESGIAPRKASV